MSQQNRTADKSLNLEDDCFVFLLKRNPKEVAQSNPMQATTVQKEEGRKLTADR